MSLSSSGHDDKSLGRLLLELCVQLALTLLPIVLCAMLPLPLSAALVLLHVLALGLAAYTGREALARRISPQLSCAMIGFGIGGRLLPGYWGIFAGIVAVFIGLAAVAAWERRLGLAEPEPGANAWGSGGPLLTPEGEPVRSFNWGEIAMGGPAWCDHLLPDGVVLEGLGSSLCFSSDGRYLAAPILPGRVGPGDLRPPAAPPPSLHQRSAVLGAGCLRWRGAARSPQPTGVQPGVAARLDTLLADARSEDFIAVGDLWLSPDRAAHLPAAREFPAPTGSHLLRGAPTCRAPCASWTTPRAPGQPRLRTGARRRAQRPVAGRRRSGHLAAGWQGAGLPRASVAELERGWSNDCWLWEEGEGWRLLDEPWQALEGEPRLNLGAPLRIDGRHLWRAAYLDFAGTDRLGFGYGLYSIHSDSETLVGVDEQGRALAGEHRLTHLSLGVSLDGAGRSGASLELQPMANGEVPRLEWLRDGTDGRQGAFACRIGDWLLDGEWCLDHRVSDCGRYLALVAFAEARRCPIAWWWRMSASVVCWRWNAPC